MNCEKIFTVSYYMGFKNTSKYSDFDKRNKLLKLKKVSGMLS